MPPRLAKILDTLRASYWFVPSLMAGLAVGLASLSVYLDEKTGARWLEQSGWLWSGGPEAARDILAVIAGSTVTVTGVVFSVTIVILTLASQQFGPRLLHNFLRDTLNQVTLGTFVGTFLYCLLVLRTVRQGDTPFVPHLSTTIGLAMAVASLAVFIAFIHHTSVSIKAENLIYLVNRDLLASIDKYFQDPRDPEDDSDAIDAQTAPPMPSNATPIEAARTGYLQAIDHVKLVETAERHGICIYLQCRPGHFLGVQSRIGGVMPPGACSREIAEAVTGAIIIDRERNAIQDIEFAITQLAEIGVRALSPGINDPFTAIACIDYLSAALSQISGRAFPSAVWRDAKGTLRLVVRRSSYASVLTAAFAPLRQYAASGSSVPVLIRLCEALERISERTRSPQRLAAIHRELESTLQSADGRIPAANDRHDFKAASDRALAAITAACEARSPR